MKWIDYVNKTAAGATQSAIGYKIGVSAATISRWATFAPRPENVASFARAYGRPVLEAFIAAGFLTAEEANEQPESVPQLSALSGKDLIREIEKRLDRLDLIEQKA